MFQFLKTLHKQKAKCPTIELDSSTITFHEQPQKNQVLLPMCIFNQNLPIQAPFIEWHESYGMEFQISYKITI